MHFIKLKSMENILNTQKYSLFKNIQKNIVPGQKEYIK